MLQIRRLGPQIGVEVVGIDVKAMGEATWNTIYQAWLDRNVMVVRDQELTIPDFIAYSERFGPVTPHPSKSTRHPDHPKITMLGVDKFDADGKLRPEIYRRGAEGWHTDGAYNQARSRRRSSTRWRCRAAAAIRSLPVATPLTKGCRSASSTGSTV
jgi:taurine dioxygenase